MYTHSPNQSVSGLRRMASRVERSEETKTRIERAALEHFVKKGFAETSIRDIATTAGLSLGAMYNHFTEGKDQLAWHLFINGWNEIGTEMRRRASAETNLLGKMRAMI